MKANLHKMAIMIDRGTNTPRVRTTLGTKFHKAFLAGFDASRYSLLHDEKGNPMIPEEQP